MGPQATGKHQLWPQEGVQLWRSIFADILSKIPFLRENVDDAGGGGTQLVSDPMIPTVVFLETLLGPPTTTVST